MKAQLRVPSCTIPSRASSTHNPTLVLWCNVMTKQEQPSGWMLVKLQVNQSLWIWTQVWLQLLCFRLSGTGPDAEVCVCLKSQLHSNITAWNAILGCNSASHITSQQGCSDLLLEDFVITCRAHSTSVTVLPVPGGPKRAKGYRPPPAPTSTDATASRC